MTLTPARAALARSAATRSGYPIAQGQRLKLYALSNVARSNATRSNYIDHRTYISIGGIQNGGTTGRVLRESLSISDVLNETPNTAQLTVMGITPTEGQEIIITLGSVNNQRREFAGWILNRSQRYVGKPANLFTDLNCVDYTWGLNRRKVSTRFLSQTLQTIVSSLISTYAPGYTVAVGADVAGLKLEDISFTAQDLTSCLTQTCKRTGTEWLCDDHKVVRVFSEDSSGTAPTPINAVHPSLTNFAASYDLSQVITRVLSEGGGAAAITTVVAGETILPVETAIWYEPSGRVAVGTQRLSYSGVDVGHAGSLVGPGAYPFDRVIANLASGTGIEDGLHEYAVSFVTSSPPGESLTGPRTPITVGLLAAPTTAPTAGPAQAGTGPATGWHGYAVSFVTAAGETPPGPLVGAASTVSDPPTTSPIPGTPTTGGSVDIGSHDYAVSFVTAIGETIVGPIGASVTTVTAAPIPSPTASPTPTTSGNVGSMDTGWHDYAVSYVTSGGETIPGPIGPAAYVSSHIADPIVHLTLTGTPAGSITAGYHDYGFTFMDAAGRETTIGSSRKQEYFNTPMGATFAVPNGNPGTVARRIYRTTSTASASAFPNGLPLYQVGTLNNNVDQASFTDTLADGSLTTSVQPPSTNQAATGAIQVTTIQIGPAGTTARKLYRRSGGVGLRLVTTLANNATDQWLDGAANASLGAAPSSSSPLGPAYQTVPLSAIEKGPTGTTARKLYRRSGGAGLRLLVTIVNNSTTTYTDTTATASLGAAPLVTSTAALHQIPLSDLPIGGPLVTARKLWGTAANVTALQLVATLADNTTTAYLVTTPDGSLGAAPPTVNTAHGNQVQLTGIPVGIQATISGRKIYRTRVGDTALRLLATIADDTTTTYLDATADAALGALAPTTDTSALQQPQGAILPGAADLLMSSTAAMPAAGWAIIGNGEQVIRYTAKTPNQLTGIPATGFGSITATIAYNSTVTGASQLTGIPASGDGAIVTTIARGDEVNLLVQEDDVAAQAALHAAIADPSFDGVQEDYLSDNRLSATEARARARAWLDLRKDVVVTVRASTRDLNTRSGRLLHVNLGAFNLIGDFMIQQVTEHAFLPALMPTFDLEASSVRFTFEDWLRIVKREGAAT